jgi:hypothetical protein
MIMIDICLHFWHSSSRLTQKRYLETGRFPGLSWYYLRQGFDCSQDLADWRS